MNVESKHMTKSMGIEVKAHVGGYQVINRLCGEKFCGLHELFNQHSLRHSVHVPNVNAWLDRALNRLDRLPYSVSDERLLVREFPGCGEIPATFAV